MRWNKYTLTTTAEAEDMISSMMMEAGIEGIEIEDKVPLSESDKSQMFVDILPEGPADDGVARISFYLEPDAGQCSHAGSCRRRSGGDQKLGCRCGSRQPLRLPRQRTRTGSITGSSIFISSMWMIF